MRYAVITSLLVIFASIIGNSVIGEKVEKIERRSADRYDQLEQLYK